MSRASYLKCNTANFGFFYDQYFVFDGNSLANWNCQSRGGTPARGSVDRTETSEWRFVPISRSSSRVLISNEGAFARVYARVFERAHVCAHVSRTSICAPLHSTDIPVFAAFKMRGDVLIRCVTLGVAARRGR